jgi:hypothetical protein
VLIAIAIAINCPTCPVQGQDQGHWRAADLQCQYSQKKETGRDWQGKFSPTARGA